MIVYGIKYMTGYRCILVVNDNFSKFGLGIPLENRAGHLITKDF